MIGAEHFEQELERISNCFKYQVTPEKVKALYSRLSRPYTDQAWTRAVDRLCCEKSFPGLGDFLDACEEAARELRQEQLAQERKEIKQLVEEKDQMAEDHPIKRAILGYIADGGDATISKFVQAELVRAISADTLPDDELQRVAEFEENARTNFGVTYPRMFDKFSIDGVLKPGVKEDELSKDELEELRFRRLAVGQSRRRR